MSEECYVYVIAHPDTNSGATPVKVGVSDAPLARFRALQTATPYALCLWRTWRFSDRIRAFQVERAYYDRNAKRRLSGEWFMTRPVGACCEVDEICIEKLILRGYDIVGIRKQANMIGIHPDSIDDILFNSHLAYEHDSVEDTP